MYLVSSAIFMNTPFDCGPWSWPGPDMFTLCFGTVVLTVSLHVLSFSLLSSFLCVPPLLSLFCFPLFTPPSLQVCVWAAGQHRGWDRCEWQICYTNTSLLPHWDPTSPQCDSVGPPLRLSGLDPSWWVAVWMDGWMDAFSLNPMASQIRHCICNDN